MSIQRLNWSNPEIVYDFSDELALPEEWVDLINRLNPLTACVVWEVLTGKLSPAVVELAQASPDIERYKVVEVIANSDPQNLASALTEARKVIDEIFIQVMPDDPRRIVH